MIGRTVSHYKIEEKLGQGGMGVVYRARDLTLGRNAAVKFLSSEIADEHRRRRFQQEAQIASSLNHPNILAVYEAGTFEGQQYLVTEFVDGSTLREWIQRDKPSDKQILELLASIADALAVAHEAGIIHRDIKPENILVARAGYAKLADFGLAKLIERPAPGEAASTILDNVHTEAGAVMGTLPYMAPEQLAGKEVGRRADVFSLGVVLYEVLVGERPFTAPTTAELSYAILHSPPKPFAERKPELAPEFDALFERALAKEPAERYQSTRDLVLDLKRATARLGQPRREAQAPAQPRRSRAPIAAAVALAIAVAAGASWWSLDRADFFWKNPLADARFERFTDFAGTEMEGVISADGKFIAFLSDKDGPFDVWVTQIGGGGFLNLTKGQQPELINDEIRNLGFSADGAQIWYRVNRLNAATGENVSSGCRLIPTIGGASRPFLNSINPAWSPDGSQLVYHNPAPGDPIFVADRNGRNPRRIYIAPPGVHCHYQIWSPDGRYIYFVSGVPRDQMDIWRVPAAGGTAEQITRHNSAVAFPAFLDNHTLLYRAAADDGTGQWLYGMDVRKRIPHRLSHGVEQYRSISASADGRRLVATVTNPTASIWRVPILDRLATEVDVRRIEIPTVRAHAPRQGRDFLLYLSSKGGAAGLWKLTGSASVELWRASEGAVPTPAALSPDGSRIAFPRREGSVIRLQVMNSDGSAPRPLATSLSLRDSPTWSPDGKWIAVAAQEGNQNGVFKVPAEGGPHQRLVTGLLRSPHWSPDGTFILYSVSREGGAGSPVKAVTPDGKDHPIPPLWVRRGGDRYRILPDVKRLVFLVGEYGSQEFWLLDLSSGQRRQLTNLKTGYDLRGFDVTPDGREIVFDRIHENSDIVLIDLPPR